MSAEQRLANWLRTVAEGPVKEACFPYFVGAAGLVARSEAKPLPRAGLRLGLLSEELLRDDPQGFGGYGQTVENIARHYPRHNPAVSVVALLSNKAHLTRQPRLDDEAGVRSLLVPSLTSLLRSPRTYVRLLQSMNPSVLLSIDYLTQYEYVLWALPRCPLIIYLRDPRAVEEWAKIAEVPLEIEAARRSSSAQLQRIAHQHHASFRRVQRWSQWCGRKLVFATNAPFLVERARRKFGLPDLNPYYLPNPIPMPDAPDGVAAPRPTLLVLGRLEPQKRPWLVLELARRLPGVRFVLAGKTRFPELMRDTLNGLAACANVELVGMVDEAGREPLLRSCWALLNTSSHEGLPVSFQEAFAHRKPVISSQNPDGLVERFGYWAGESRGSGMDGATLGGFERCIAACISDVEKRRAKGVAARRYVEETHSFASFDRHLQRLLGAEGLAA